jgi:hypothetical protein
LSEVSVDVASENHKSLQNAGDKKRKDLILEEECQPLDAD